MSSLVHGAIGQENMPLSNVTYIVIRWDLPCASFDEYCNADALLSGPFHPTVVL